MINYYNLVLGLIPVVLAVGAGVLAGIGTDLETALSVAALATAGIIGHALFVRTPTNSRDGTRGVPSAAE